MTGAKTSLGEPSGVPCADLLLRDGDLLEIGQQKIYVISTPGHTDACTCFKVNGILFTGDTLFIRGCGRTDFQSGSSEELYNTIKKTFYSMPDETKIYPAHDYNKNNVSTIREQKKYNMLINENIKIKDFVNSMSNLKLDKPKKMDFAVPLNNKCGINDLHEKNL